MISVIDASREHPRHSGNWHCLMRERSILANYRKINVSSWIVIARLPNGFPRQKITSWRLADSLPPGELSDGKYAA
jgi:hypothetical protein